MKRDDFLSAMSGQAMWTGSHCILLAQDGSYVKITRGRRDKAKVDAFPSAQGDTARSLAKMISYARWGDPSRIILVFKDGTEFELRRPA